MTTSPPLKPVVPPADPASPKGPLRIALVGNPNTGKTTLFNRLCGLRHKTSNFPGTTQEARIGFPQSSDLPAHSEIIDLPGLYALDLDQSEASIVRRVLTGRTAPVGEPVETPDAVLVVLDATNLPRNLVLAGQVMRLGIPMVVALTMSDLAERRGIGIDSAKLADRLGCPVVACDARRGRGVWMIPAALAEARRPIAPEAEDEDALVAWADLLYADVASGDAVSEDTLTRRLDRAFTHPVIGVALFTAIMTGLFYVIFKLAAYPMDWIDMVFASLGGLLGDALPAGILRDLLVDGVVAGVGATVIFLPQICLLFFLISLLEDTGYLARASFVIDRVLRPFGLSGHAFVPFLSSHACALPGIMAARAVPDRRERLATILTAPFMSCTARIPVYVLLTVLLFPDSPAMQAVAFTGCYALGIGAGLFSALLARRTILKGRSRPMAMELPSYRIPSVRTALLTTWDRGIVFLRKAGTLILAISIVLWWLGTYPVTPPPAEAEGLRAQSAALIDAEPERAAELEREAAVLEGAASQRGSFLGRLGSFVQPVFEPLGYDRKLTIGVLASFAAREVFVTTMAVQTVGAEDVEEEGVLDALAQAERDDGTPIFTMPVAWSLLVYYVLAMQCLPTLAVTAKEAGHWKWALLQVGWMCGLAYAGALIVFQILTAAGG